MHSAIWGRMNGLSWMKNRVFNKGRQLVKLVRYPTWTCHLFDWEVTLYFMTSMRNIHFKTWALDRPRFVHEKQKNLAWTLSNFRGDLCFLFCSNTLILAPECRKCILRGPNFQNFPREHTPGPLKNLAPSARAVHSLPIPTILPPIQIPIENPGKSCQSLGNNKMADQNNAASTANLNSPAEHEEENLWSVFNLFFWNNGFFYSNNSDHFHSALSHSRRDQGNAPHVLWELLLKNLGFLEWVGNKMQCNQTLIRSYTTLGPFTKPIPTQWLNWVWLGPVECDHPMIQLITPGQNSLVNN